MDEIEKEAQAPEKEESESKQGAGNLIDVIRKQAEEEAALEQEQGSEEENLPTAKELSERFGGSFAPILERFKEQIQFEIEDGTRAPQIPMNLKVLASQMSHIFESAVDSTKLKLKDTEPILSEKVFLEMCRVDMLINDPNAVDLFSDLGAGTDTYWIVTKESCRALDENGIVVNPGIGDEWVKLQFYDELNDRTLDVNFKVTCKFLKTKQMYYKIILLFSIMLGMINSIQSQEKKYKNEFAYRVDSTIYDYQVHELTKRTAHCKEIIANQKRKNKNEWIENEWFIEQNELLKAKDLIIVKHICLTENLLPSEFCEPFLSEPAGTILGPFQSDYGQFRFVKITGSSEDLPRLSNGESSIFGWLLLENKNKSSKRIEKVAAEIITRYDRGLGSKKCVDRKLKRHEKNKAVASDCVCCSKDADKKRAAAPAGNTWYTMNCPSGLAIVRMHKIPSYTRYVYYTEYIFK